MQEFPDCFPDDFILPENAGFYEQNNVYRILPYGNLDRNGFLPTYEDNIIKRIPQPVKPNASTYSTSCAASIDYLKNILQVHFRGLPAACIARGTILPKCGPSTLPNKNSHIDWWIYKDAEPELYFEKV